MMGGKFCFRVNQIFLRIYKAICFTVDIVNLKQVQYFSGHYVFYVSSYLFTLLKHQMETFTNH